MAGGDFGFYQAAVEEFEATVVRKVQHDMYWHNKTRQQACDDLGVPHASYGRYRRNVADREAARGDTNEG